HFLPGHDCCRKLQLRRLTSRTAPVLSFRVHREGSRMTLGRWRFVLGVVLAAGLLLILAEGFLRLFPPRDLHQFLGEESPLTDVYKPAPASGVTSRDWDAFAVQNGKRLAPYLPLKHNPDARPTWAFFGNSFVQAPGMLADHARARVTDHRIFNLG